MQMLAIGLPGTHFVFRVRFLREKGRFIQLFLEVD